MEQLAQLQRLGWEWRENGVILCVVVDGKTQRVFVPLAKVWITFDQELTSVGCPVAPESVGETFSVGGFFSSITKAVSKAVSPIKKLVPKAVSKAVNKVTSVAKKYASAAINAARKIPVLGNAINAYGTLVALPYTAATQLLDGKRIDKIAIGNFKSALGAAKTLAPYVQTVISVVPGVGQGISAGIGGALALASGQSITDAMLAATKAAIPGGPMAQAAFSVAAGAIQGKSIDTIALNALPIGATEKAALLRGLSAAKALAAGQRVDQVIIDQAMRSLPPAAQKAIQVGVAMGQAKNLQQAAKSAAGGALAITGAHSAGVAAARKYAQGVRTPAVVNAMQRGVLAKRTLSSIVAQAARGNHQAGLFTRALVGLKR